MRRGARFCIKLGLVPGRNGLQKYSERIINRFGIVIFGNVVEVPRWRATYKVVLSETKVAVVEPSRTVAF